MGVAILRKVAGPQKTAGRMYVHNASTEIGCGCVAGRRSDALEVADPICMYISYLVVLTV